MATTQRAFSVSSTVDPPPVATLEKPVEDRKQANSSKEELKYSVSYVCTYVI